MVLLDGSGLVVTGRFNVWHQPLTDGVQAVQVTQHQGQPVRFLSVVSNGTLAYGFESEIWRRTVKCLSLRCRVAAPAA